MIAVVALTADTSDWLQPLDVYVFGPLKHFTNAAVVDITRDMETKTPNNVYMKGLETWEEIERAYLKAITPAKVMSGFRQNGMWPFYAVATCQAGIRSSILEEGLVSAEILLDNTSGQCRVFKRREPSGRALNVCGGLFHWHWKQNGTDASRPA